jgi:hypothetical protein
VNKLKTGWGVGEWVWEGAANSHNDRLYRYEDKRREGEVLQNAIVRWEGEWDWDDEGREEGSGHGWELYRA